MLRYKLFFQGIKDWPATVSLDTKDPDEFIPIVVEGHPLTVAAILRELPKCGGMFGHGIEISSTTPIDLNAALMHRGSRMEQFSPELIEGAEILEGWSYKFPEGVCS